MKRSALSPLPALALLAFAACAPSRPPVELDWTFAGKNCQQAGVATIQVDVLNEVLTPNTFSCTGGGSVTTGASLGHYLTGVYTVTVTGYDAGNNVAYRGTQDFRVSGGGLNQLVLDVPAAAPTTGSVTLLWTFAGKSCAQAGITSVRATMDGVPLADASNNIDLPCSANGHDGTTLSPVAAGTHTFALQGLRNGAVAYSLDNLQVAAVAGQDVSVAPDLGAAQPTTATAQLRWSFAGADCPGAQVDLVRVAVDGRVLSPDFPCTSGGVDGGEITGLSSGNHTFTLQGIRNGTGGATLVYEALRGATASFSIGLTTQVLVDAPAASPDVGGAQLFWQFPAGGPQCSSGSPTTSIAYQITSPGQAVTSGTSSCGGPTGNQGVRFCSPTSADCRGMPGLVPGNWTVTAQTTVNGITYKATGIVFPVPNAAESQNNILFARQ